MGKIKKCAKCKGTGKIHIDEWSCTCKKCKGKGTK